MVIKRFVFGWLILCLINAVLAGPVRGAAMQDSIRIAIREGSGAVNASGVVGTLRVQVQDSFARGIPGATVVFRAPTTGPSGTFTGGLTMTTVTTDASGNASASGYRSNNLAGSYEISVTATYAGNEATAAIPQSNAEFKGRSSKKWYAILGGAVAVVVVVMLLGRDSSSNAAIRAGVPTVDAP